MTIHELLTHPELPIAERVEQLTKKAVRVPQWEHKGVPSLADEYYPERHAVMDKHKYPDIVSPEGVEEVTRITIDLQRLSVKRMTELMTGVPIKHVFKPENDKQREVADYLAAIFGKMRFDSFNIERLNLLFAACEFVTLWYAVEEQNGYYGFESPVKLRAKNFSPMLGHSLYPLFDDYGDLTALSIAYEGGEEGQRVRYLDVYTDALHVKYRHEEGAWFEDEREAITIGKIPAIYCHRPTPIWENGSRIVAEMEWALSRNGNYLRQNSKPLFVVYADEAISYGDEKSPDREFRSVMQYPKGSSAGYITWSQAVESLKFHVETLRSLFFTQLQLPDWNYEKMSSTPMSGEARKQLFIDAQLKVKDESGRIAEALSRELNVARAFLKQVLPRDYHKDIDALRAEVVITPFTINDERERIDNLLAANGNKPLMSQRESIEQLGKSADAVQTMREIAEENMADALDFAQ